MSGCTCDHWPHKDSCPCVDENPTTSGVPDPDSSGGTGWHMHAATFDRHATVHNEVYRCDAPLGDPRPVKSVLVIPAASARDTIARALDDMNVSGWLVYPHPNTGEPMQEEVPLGYIAEGVIAALVREAGR